MAIDNDEIVVGANGSIYVANVGATEPTDILSGWAAAWTNLGYATEDGVTITDGKTITDKMAWQSFHPVRKLVTGRMFTVSFTLIQWNLGSVVLAFGGGSVSTPSAGVYKYTPPTPENIDERALGIEWTDGAPSVHKTYRLIVPRCIVSENVETVVSRTDSANLPITVAAVGEAGTNPWYLLTNDASMAAS
jgi:hypothetical protein